MRIGWGAAGKPAQRIDRDFVTPDAALAYTEKQIAAQLAKGYAEVAAEREHAPPLPDARHARFEWRTDAAQYYRDLVLSGTKVHDRSGTVDDNGRESIGTVDTRHCPTLEAAHARFDALCEETRARGGEWIDLAARAAQRTIAARQPAGLLHPVTPTYSDLEAQCLEAPDTEDPWLVYADHLEAIGDPRGKIAALARAGRAVSNQLRDQLVGIADDDELEEDERGCADHEVKLVFELKFGFVRHVQVALDRDAKIALDVVVRRLLATPIARFVDSLRFGLTSYEGDNDWTPVLRAVVESAQARHMRALAFDAYTREDQEISWVAYGHFNGLIDQLPALAHLHVRAGPGGTLGTLPRSLRTLIRESGGLARKEIAEILAQELPHLAHLELWTGSRHYGGECSLTDLERILEARDLPQLAHLGIVNSELVDELIPALATSRILPQLTSLDLSRGIAATDAADALVANARAFRHLAAIDLSANLLDASEVTRIRDVLDNVIVADQRPLDDERYVALGE